MMHAKKTQKALDTLCMLEHFQLFDIYRSLFLRDYKRTIKRYKKHGLTFFAIYKNSNTVVTPGLLQKHVKKV